MQRLVAFDADRLRDAVLVAPVVLGLLTVAEEFGELGDSPSGVMTPEGEAAQERQHGDRGTAANQPLS